jgi:UDP-2,3-diacylglucosamine pyrophosphatase LpxH
MWVLGKGGQIRQGKPVFVISDLHIGDRSPRDNLCRGDRERLLDSFLDHVQNEDGQLVIIGDFFELLRYPLESILSRRADLLDRLADMETLYVPGNHDEAALALKNEAKPPHPFFRRMGPAFTQHIGDKRFKFMHGHEVDPFINAGVQSLGRMIGAVAYMFEFRQGTCLLSNDSVCDVLLEMGEQALRCWGWLTRGMNKALRECCHMMPAEKVTLLTRGVRTHRMLARYYEDKSDDFYDVAIVGHTHKAGTFGNWYFNSGSWTGPTNNYLRIAPDGDVGVFDWGPAGSQTNETIILEN